MWRVTRGYPNNGMSKVICSEKRNETGGKKNSQKGSV